MLIIYINKETGYIEREGKPLHFKDLKTDPTFLMKVFHNFDYFVLVLCSLSFIFLNVGQLFTGEFSFLLLGVSAVAIVFLYIVLYRQHRKLPALIDTPHKLRYELWLFLNQIVLDDNEKDFKVKDYMLRSGGYFKVSRKDLSINNTGMVEEDYLPVRGYTLWFPFQVIGWSIKWLIRSVRREEVQVEQSEDIPFRTFYQYLFK